MDIVRLIETLEDIDIIYDNENLSLPYFVWINGEPEIAFFLYTVEYGKTGCFLSKRVIIGGDGIKQQIINKYISSIGEQEKELFPYISKKRDVQEYLDVAMKMQKMLDNDFSTSYLKEYVESLKTYISIDMIATYRIEAGEYLEFLDNGLKELKENKKYKEYD